MDQNKIIAAIAKKTLGPLGLKRDGKSRIWYDDHGWWAIVVEFQPSSWRSGSYLNVGVSWMLYENSHWSFDIGYRENGFRSATNEEQFKGVMADVAAHASGRVLEYRRRFASLSGMYAVYRDLKNRTGWPDYYAGILAGLGGDRRSAEQHFTDVTAMPGTVDWHHALRLRTMDLKRLLAEPNHFRESVLGIVLRCRSVRCLDQIPIDEIGLP